MLSLGVLSAEQGFDRFGHVRGVGVGNNLIEERNALQPVLPDKSCGFCYGFFQAAEDRMGDAKLGFPAPVVELFEH